MEDWPGSTLAGGLVCVCPKFRLVLTENRRGRRKCIIFILFWQGMANQKHAREQQRGSKGIRKEEPLCTCCWAGGLFCQTRAD